MCGQDAFQLVRDFPLTYSAAGDQGCWVDWCGVRALGWGGGVSAGVLWLKFGVWVALPARYLFINLTPADALAAIPADSQVNPSDVYAAFAELCHTVPSLGTAHSDAWIRGYPISWVGLHKLIVGALDRVSIPFIAVVIGLTPGVKALGWVAAFDEDEKRRRKGAE